ncbi:MAG: hypothetical protein GXY83_22200 [Rhodopirellula sp.]|nr:hypothetical protein [Rhodopirellula sp.]
MTDRTSRPAGILGVQSPALTGGFAMNRGGSRWLVLSGLLVFLSLMPAEQETR